MKTFLRIIVGVIFIISGFVNAVDITGFSFKLEEYFSAAVFNMPFFEKWALQLAIFVVLFELILGVMLLLKMALKPTLAALILLCVFFAFLTFYSAYFDKVTDCGCFGDAVKFTPWQSFFKDIILLVGLILLWFLYKKDFSKIQNPKSKIQNPKKILFVLSAIASVFIIVHGIIHEPLIDFRDYKIGTDLTQEKEKINQNPSEYKTFYTLKNTKTGEEKTVNQDDYVNVKAYWEEGTPWEIEKGKNVSKLMKKGYISEVEKFKIEDAEGMDLTDEILKSPKAVLIFSYAPEKADKNLLAQTEAKVKSLKNVLVLGISTNPDTFKTIENAMMDGTAIKTIARSNPFVLILQNGKITEKMSAKDFLKIN
jgi:uncharacterized membrane protein YphA (DoxX/SURF4 family)